MGHPPHRRTERAPITWSAFIAEYPNATILPVGSGGGVGFNVGSSWTSVTGDVGDFTIGTSTGTTAYTFDPSAPTTTTTTTPTDTSFVLGGSNTDTATVTGNPVVGSPTGTVSVLRVRADLDAHALHLHCAHRR